MEVTLIGTGSPIPFPNRAGTSILLRVGPEAILIDCGPSSVMRLVEYNKDISSIQNLFLTHHHFDHTSDFYNFVISSWSLGRNELTIHGPEKTDLLLESMYSVYEEDLSYRNELDYPTSGIEDIAVHRVSEGFQRETERWSVSALPVEHSIETYAYKFREHESGATFVFSGDTRYIDFLGDFAQGADLLVQDTCVGPFDGTNSADNQIWNRFATADHESVRSFLRKTHCDAREAGKIASQAEVDTLVLSHLLPYRDGTKMIESASEEFMGDIVFAEDGMEFNL